MFHCWSFDGHQPTMFTHESTIDCRSPEHSLLVEGFEPFFECRGGLLWNKLPIAIFQHETLRTLPSFLFQKIARFSTSSWHDPAGFRSLVHHDIHIPGGSPPWGSCWGSRCGSRLTDFPDRLETFAVDSKEKDGWDELPWFLIVIEIQLMSTICCIY